MGKRANHAVAVAVGFLVTGIVLFVAGVVYDRGYDAGELAGYMQGIKDATTMPPEVVPHD